jgi:hypothetical protein
MSSISLLQKATTGVVKRPHYILMHGLPGLGKSTFASKAPNPIFLCSEKGTSHLNVTRLELDSFDQFMQAINELQGLKHDFKTVVIDTVDHIEPLIFKEICKEEGKESIEQIGYGKGYAYALEYWRKLVDGLEALREKGMNIILLAHTEIKAHNDPQLSSAYDRYQVKLHSKAASLIIDRVDCVLFANYKTYITQDGASKVKALGDGSRIVYTELRPSFIAKNRFNLPYEIPLEWEDFAKGCEEQKSLGVEEYKKNILELLPLVKDAEIKKKVEDHLKQIGDDPTKLGAVVNRLKTIIAA